MWQRLGSRGSCSEVEKGYAIQSHRSPTHPRRTRLPRDVHAIAPSCPHLPHNPHTVVPIIGHIQDNTHSSAWIENDYVVTRNDYEQHVRNMQMTTNAPANHTLGARASVRAWPHQTIFRKGAMCAQLGVRRISRERQMCSASCSKKRALYKLLDHTLPPYLCIV